MKDAQTTLRGNKGPPLTDMSKDNAKHVWNSTLTYLFYLFIHLLVIQVCCKKKRKPNDQMVGKSIMTLGLPESRAITVYYDMVYYFIFLRRSTCKNRDSNKI